MIFDKRHEENIVFYSGNNKQEIIDFFPSFKEYFSIINDELHFIVKDYYYPDKTLIKPNHYITLKYDEDEWWYCRNITVKEFDLHFIEIK